MNKSELVAAIISELEERHRAAVSATQTAIEAATDEETVPEHKYDTLALEASYLAHGQSVRVAQCLADIEAFRKMPIKEPGQCDTVSVGALVELCDESEISSHFFLGPCAGGLSLCFSGLDISVITAQAPLGREMLGKQTGDEVELDIAGKKVWYEILSII